MLPYRGVLSPATVAARRPVRITDGGLAVLRAGHDPAATLAAVERCDALDVLVRPRRPRTGVVGDPAPGHLALVPARRAADVPAVLGWDGGGDDPAGMSAVLRRWEECFGARLVRIERAALEFALDGAPWGDPTAEHIAFCGGPGGAVCERGRWWLVPGRACEREVPAGSGPPRTPAPAANPAEVGGTGRTRAPSNSP